MKICLHIVLICASILLHFEGATADKICSSPSANVGQYVGRDHECVALIQTKCAGVGLTRNWRRGTRVKGNCGRISPNTAIATFEGPNYSYNTPGYKKQHAAIFVSCDGNGITVYDQYNGSGGVKRRILRYGGNGVNNGDLFYTIQ